MKLKDIRIANGLTQQALSQASGVAREVICRIETGSVTPELPTLIKLADALKCSLDELAGRSAIA